MNAKDERIAELESLVETLLEKIAELEAEIAALKKNSSALCHFVFGIAFLGGNCYTAVFTTRKFQTCKKFISSD